MSTLIFNTAKPILTPDVELRVNLGLDNIRTGSERDLLTPLGKAHGPESLLLELDELFKTRTGVNDTLLQIENLQRSKYGPRSISKPWSDIKEEFYEQYTQSTYTLPKVLIRPLAPALKRLSFDEGLRAMRNSTNSGLPQFVKKYEVKTDYNISKWNEELSMNYPCLMFRRTQEQKKTRIVWGYPFALTLLATMYFYPMLKYERKFAWRSALRGPDEVSRRMTDILAECNKREDLTVIGVDFTLFDRSAKEPFVLRSVERLSKLFIPDDNLETDLRIISDNMTGIGIITPDGLAEGKHGLASGSPGTNTIGSDVQFLLARQSGMYETGYEDVTGDDGVYLIKKKNVDKFIEFFKSYGFNLNKEKSSISRDYVIYLQNLYHKDYFKDGKIGGIYPIYRALNRLVHQERWTDLDVFERGSDYYSIRTISILENCKHHPLFERFVEFIYKKDKYALAYNDKSLSTYVETVYGSLERRELNRNQYGQYLGGIAEFETVKIISRLNKLRG